jgi:hypothetical protein
MRHLRAMIVAGCSEDSDMQTQQAGVGIAGVRRRTTTAEGLAARVDQTLTNSRRLEVVGSSGLLDTQSEEEFDSLSRLAATLIGAPVSFLSILDRQLRQVLSKGQFGDAQRQRGGGKHLHHRLR